MDEAVTIVIEVEVGLGIERTIDCEDGVGLNTKDLLVAVLVGHHDGGLGRVRRPHARRLAGVLEDGIDSLGYVLKGEVVRSVLVFLGTDFALA